MLKKYGWKKNPFDPSHPDPEFLIYEQQTKEIIEKIKESRLLWINAAMGVGKTTILRYISEYGHKHGLCAFYWHYGSNPKVEEFKQASQMLYPGFFEKHIFGCKTRAVLIDEANYIEDADFYRYLVGLLDDPKIFPSLVFASVTEPPEELLFKTFKDRPLETMSIKPVTDKELLDMVEKRIKKAGGKGLIAPFDRETVLSIIKTTDTPRAVLEKLMMLASGDVFKPEKRDMTIPTPQSIGEGMVKPFTGLGFLSTQQKKIVDTLSDSGSMSLNEISIKLGIKKSSARVQLYRLASAGFLKDKGYKRPIIEKSGDKWQIHKEYKIAEKDVSTIKPVIKTVKKPIIESLREKKASAPLLKKEEEKMPGEEIVEQILVKHKALDIQTAIPKKTLIDMLSQEMKCDKNEAENIFIQLWNRGRLVYLDDKEKVFSVFGYKKK